MGVSLPFAICCGDDMNYLFRYLTALRPHEVGRVAAITASRRELETIELLMSLRTKPEASREDAMRRLGMSGSMFDKTCSLILRRLLAEKVPEGGIPLIEHLVEQCVHDLMLHELRRQEKEHLKTGERDRLATFYGEAFRVLHRRFSSDYSERLARQIAAKYIRLNPSPDTAIYAEASLIRMAIWTEASRRRGAEHRARLEKRLRRNDARITETTGPPARFMQLKAWITYYGQLKRDTDRRMECLRASVDLCERYPTLFPLQEYVLTLCQIAEEHYFYHTDLVRPLTMYRELYERYPEILKTEDYHTFKFIQLCLINGEYRQAEDLLTNHFGTETNFEVPGGGRSKTVAMLWTKLFLLTDRLAEARRHLDDAILLNKKGFYLQFEIECRMLHTVLSFLEGDFDLVERRLATHVKFLRSKGFTYSTSRYYPWFFKLVGAFIDERMTGKKPSPKLEGKLEEFKEGAAAQYGMLLRKMRSA